MNWPLPSVWILLIDALNWVEIMAKNAKQYAWGVWEVVVMEITLFNLYKSFSLIPCIKISFLEESLTKKTSWWNYAYTLLSLHNLCT